VTAIYPLAREGFLTGQINWASNTIVTHLVDGTYVYDEAHQFQSNLTGIIATSAAMTNKTSTGGVADADDVIFPAVAAGPDIAGVVVAVSTGNPATSRLILHVNTDTASQAILVERDGSDVRVTWSNGPLKIFRL
jgi:hypothetical protein